MVKKRVKFNIEKTQELLKYLSQFLTITQIAHLKKVSFTAIYKRINRLIQKGYIRKIGKGYELTDLGLNYLNKYSPNQIRLHNLAFKVNILSNPRNWELKRSKVVQMRVLSKSVALQNTSYEIHSFSNLKVKTTSKSILFYMPAFYGHSTDDCFKQSLDSLWNSIPKIENLFKIVLIKDRKCNIEVISSHYAKLQDSLAKLYKLEGNKLYVKDEQDNIWLIADFSFRESELETIYNKTSKEDMDTVKDFLNDLRKNPATISQVTGLINQVTANQVIFDKNMTSHISAIQELGKGVKKLTKVMRGILKENQSLKLQTKHQKQLGEFI